MRREFRRAAAERYRRTRRRPEAPGRGPGYTSCGLLLRRPAQRLFVVAIVGYLIGIGIAIPCAWRLAPLRRSVTPDPTSELPDVSARAQPPSQLAGLPDSQLLAASKEFGKSVGGGVDVVLPDRTVVRGGPQLAGDDRRERGR